MKIMVNETQAKLISDEIWADVEKGWGAAFKVEKGTITNSKKFLVPLSMMVPNQKDKEGNNDVIDDNVKDIIKKLESGGSVTPIFLHKLKKGFLVVDGHHRYEALKRMGKKYGVSIIIPSKNVKFVKDMDKSPLV